MGGFIRILDGVLGGGGGGGSGIGDEYSLKSLEGIKKYNERNAAEKKANAKVGDLKGGFSGDERWTAAELGIKNPDPTSPASPVPSPSDTPRFALSSPEKVSMAGTKGSEMISKGGDPFVSAKEEDAAKQASVEERRKKSRKQVSLLGLTNPTSNLSGL